MNDIFNLKRMALYLRKQYSENPKTYLWGLLVTFLDILIINNLFIIKTGYPAAPVFMLLFYILLILVYLPEIMKPFYRKGTKIQALTLPVSRLEQYLTILLAVIIIWIITLIAYIGSIYILKSCFEPYPNIMRHIYSFWTREDTIILTLITTIAIIWTVAGSNKNLLKAYCITLIKFMGIQIIIFLPAAIKNILVNSSSTDMFPPYLYLRIFNSYPEANIDYRISWLSEQQINIIVITFTIITFTVFLISGYYRHRERQVK